MTPNELCDVYAFSLEVIDKAARCSAAFVLIYIQLAKHNFFFLDSTGCLILFQRVINYTVFCVI